MKTLSLEIKSYIVQQLACFESPMDVVNSVRESYEIEISRQAVQKYDPTKSSGSKLSNKFKALFNNTRNAFLTEVSTIPIANKVYRLRALQKVLDKCISRTDYQGMLKVLEQAAKETGNFYTV